jgi:transporter family-2 protein
VGVLIAFQQAINGRVTVESGQPLAATWINFALGTFLLVGIFVVSLLLGGEVAPFSGGHALLYTGGLIGLVFIALAAWAVTRIGVLVTSLLAIAGQLSSALVLDLVLPTPGAQVSAGLIIGVALAFVAVVVGARRRPVT